MGKLGWPSWIVRRLGRSGRFLERTGLFVRASFRRIGDNAGLFTLLAALGTWYSASHIARSANASVESAAAAKASLEAASENNKEASRQQAENMAMMREWLDMTRREAADKRAAARVLTDLFQVLSRASDEDCEPLTFAEVRDRYRKAFRPRDKDDQPASDETLRDDLAQLVTSNIVTRLKGERYYVPPSVLAPEPPKIDKK